MKNLPLWFLLLLAGTALLGCLFKNNQLETARQRLPLKVVHMAAITPVNLPTTLLDGHPFPDTTDIAGWVQNQDTAQIYLHGWSS